MIILTDDDTSMLLTDDDALAKDMSKESSKDSAKERSKEIVDVVRLRVLIKLTSVKKITVLYMLTSNDRHQPALTSIYKTCNYFILVSWNQTIKVTTSKGSWALSQGIVQGKFQGNNNYRFLGTFLGQLLGQGPKDVEMLSP